MKNMIQLIKDIQTTGHEYNIFGSYVDEEIPEGVFKFPLKGEQEKQTAAYLNGECELSALTFIHSLKNAWIHPANSTQWNVAKAVNKDHSLIPAAVRLLKLLHIISPEIEGSIYNLINQEGEWTMDEVFYVDHQYNPAQFFKNIMSDNVNSNRKNLKELFDVVYEKTPQVLPGFAKAEKQNHASDMMISRTLLYKHDPGKYPEYWEDSVYYAIFFLYASFVTPGNGNRHELCNTMNKHIQQSNLSKEIKAWSRGLSGEVDDETLEMSKGHFNDLDSYKVLDIYTYNERHRSHYAHLAMMILDFKFEPLMTVYQCALKTNYRWMMRWLCIDLMCYYGPSDGFYGNDSIYSEGGNTHYNGDEEGYNQKLEKRLKAITPYYIQSGLPCEYFAATVIERMIERGIDPTPVYEMLLKDCPDVAGKTIKLGNPLVSAWILRKLWNKGESKEQVKLVEEQLATYITLPGRHGYTEFETKTYKNLKEILADNLHYSTAPPAHYCMTACLMYDISDLAEKAIPQSISNIEGVVDTWSWYFEFLHGWNDKKIYEYVNACVEKNAGGADKLYQSANRVMILNLLETVFKSNPNRNRAFLDSCLTDKSKKVQKIATKLRSKIKPQEVKPDETKQVVKKFSITGESEGITQQVLMDQFLAEKDCGETTHIYIGDELADSFYYRTILKNLIEYKEKLPNLKHLQVGPEEYEGEEWIKHCNLIPFMKAFPGLESIVLNGSYKLRFSEPITMPRLKKIVVMSHMFVFADDILNINAPNLEHFEIWIDENGLDDAYTTKQLQSFFDGTRFPKLKYLGIKNCMFSAKVMKTIAATEFADSLETLDFAFSSVNNKLAKILMKAKSINKLKTIDLSENSISESMIEKLEKLPVAIIAEDCDDDDEEAFPSFCIDHQWDDFYEDVDDEEGEDEDYFGAEKRDYKEAVKEEVAAVVKDFKRPVFEDGWAELPVHKAKKAAILAAKQEYRAHLEKAVSIDVSKNFNPESLSKIKNAEYLRLQYVKRKDEVFDYISAPLKGLYMSASEGKFDMSRIKRLTTLEVIETNGLAKFDGAAFTQLPNLKCIITYWCEKFVKLEALLDIPTLQHIHFNCCDNVDSKALIAEAKKRGVRGYLEPCCNGFDFIICNALETQSIETKITPETKKTSMEHMQRILEKLNKLREQDKTHNVFGSDRHKYKLNPVLTEDEIKVYEEKNDLALPGDYRWFLLNMGNGGAGPHYGLYKLSSPRYDDDYPFVYGQMFSIVQNEEDVDFDSDEDDEDGEPLYSIRENIVYAKSQQSTIEICTEGCGMEIMLVLKGQEKGAVWFTDFGNESGLFPIESQITKGTSMTFAEWYEGWLDAALAGKGYDAESFIDDDSLTQIEVTEEEIEEYKEGDETGKADEDDEEEDEDGDEEDEDEAENKLAQLKDIEGYVKKYTELGNSQMTTGQFDAGLKTYSEAIIRADFDRAYLQYFYVCNLRNVLEFLKGKEAKKCIDILIPESKKLLQLIPEEEHYPIYAEIYKDMYRVGGNNFAWYSFERKENLEEALKVAELAAKHIAGNKSRYFIYDTLVRILIALDRKKEAYAIVDKVLEEVPAFGDFQDFKNNKDFLQWQKQNNGKTTATVAGKPTASSNKAVSLSIGNAWDDVLKKEFEADYFKKLQTFLDEEYSSKTIYPKREDVFNALKFSAPDKVRVVILGQDPYINEGQAHGFALSVLPGIAPPPSLKNMYKELESDLGITASKSGYLMKWAEQGVLLLNTVLTVEAGKSNSHAKKGWEKFTDAVFAHLGASEHPIVFMLWGKPAQAKEKFITGKSHCIIKSPHPSPLSASTGFFGSKPYSQANAFLKEKGLKEIDWKVE